MDVNYTNENQNFVRFSDGTNASFSIIEMNGEKYLAKKYDNPWDHRYVKVIQRFQKLSYDKVNAFPVGEIFIDKKSRGYLSKYYEDAVNFSDELCSVIPYDIRYQATLDISSQLRFLHENGFIVNDVRLANNLISFREQCGVMIDFEDMILEDDYRTTTSTYYYFYESGTGHDLPPSKWEDAKKQFICNTSLLLGIDLEKAFISDNNIYNLVVKFSFDKDIYDFSRTLFNSDEVLYFDEIASRFRDEERVKHWIKRM